MNNAIAYTNKVSTIVFTFGNRAGVLANINGKVQALSPNAAEGFIDALKEAGYTAVA